MTIEFYHINDKTYLPIVDRLMDYDTLNDDDIDKSAEALQRVYDVITDLELRDCNEATEYAQAEIVEELIEYLRGL